MKKLLFVLIVLGALGAMIHWRLQERKVEMSEQEGMMKSRGGRSASVEAARPTYRDIRNTFEATGSLEAIDTVKISARVTGRIAFLAVREGDRVRQGQVLARLDLSEVEAQVHQQEAAVAEAKFRLEQAKLTQTTTDTSVATQVRQQEAAVGSAEADVRQAEQTSIAQREAVKATLEDADGKIEAAKAVVANANANIRSAQANLDNATTKYNRIFGLYKQGYVAAQDVDDAKTTVSVQQAQVDTAKGQLQSASAALTSVQAQRRSVEQQGAITRAKAEADLTASRAKLAQVKAALELARANTNQTPAYAQNLSALRAGVAMAAAGLANARAKLADAVLTSPLDGVVTARTQDPGGLASPGQPLLTIQALETLWVSVAVPDDVVAKLHLSQPVTLTFDAQGGATVTARIAQINPSADPQSRQYTVRALLPNRGGKYAPGMFVRVTLVTAEARHVLAVPREAVKQDRDGGDVVFVVVRDTTRKPDVAPAPAAPASGAPKTAPGGPGGTPRIPMKAEQRPVVLGLADADWIGIAAGLEPAEMVVTMSAMPLRDGQAVNPGRGKRRGGKGGAPAAGGGEKPAADRARPVGTRGGEKTAAPATDTPRGASRRGMSPSSVPQGRP